MFCLTSSWVWQSFNIFAMFYFCIKTFIPATFPHQRGRSWNGTSAPTPTFPLSSLSWNRQANISGTFQTKVWCLFHHPTRCTCIIYRKLILHGRIPLQYCTISEKTFQISLHSWPYSLSIEKQMVWKSIAIFYYS